MPSFLLTRSKIEKTFSTTKEKPLSPFRNLFTLGKICCFFNLAFGSARRTISFFWVLFVLFLLLPFMPRRWALPPRAAPWEVCSLKQAFFCHRGLRGPFFFFSEGNIGAWPPPFGSFFSGLFFQKLRRESAG